MSSQFLVRDTDPQTVQHLCHLGLHPVLARVLAGRGIGTREDLQLSSRQLLPPGTLRAGDQAAQLLCQAIDAQQRILIVADYDCDGATACAVAVRGLRAMGARHVDYLVPNRFEYGYGLTPELVDLAARRQPDLIITVDNGIASVDGVDRATQLGIRVLITDHHLPGDQLPKAAAIVNPNQGRCDFPSRHLAGVGVMFYVLLLLRAHLRQRGAFTEQTQPRLDALLDLVAVGTVADLVRLDRNNRILVQAGLDRIRRGVANVGILALFRQAGRDPRQARSADLGFAIGPRINAAGRLDDMTVGIACLTTDDPAQAARLAQQLDDLNKERRQIEAGMQAQALQDLAHWEDGSLDAERKRTLTVYRDTWHAGVVGLIASRIKEKHHRPTIAFAPADDTWLRGSGRSIDGFHLRDTLDLVTKAHPGMIERFGGHAMAAGLTLARHQLDAFALAFEDAARLASDPQIYRRRLLVDGPLSSRDITMDLLAATDAHVWGQGFPEPLFANEFEVLEQRLLKDAHLKLSLRLDGRTFSAMWFRRTEPLPDRAHLAYRLALNDYRGERSLVLHIEQMAG
jgi:single-stranded-DNA-specific exonuclease